MKIKTAIRKAVPGDIPELVRLCKEHAAYEQSVYESTDQELQLQKALFGEEPKLFCLVLATETDLLGYASYMKQYSTWDARWYLYLDCLFLKGPVRGMGYGKKIIRLLQREAVRLECSHLQWQTPDFNTRAIDFYTRLGASSRSKERFFLNIS